MIVDVYIFRLGRLVQTTEPLSCRVIASEICDIEVSRTRHSTERVID